MALDISADSRMVAAAGEGGAIRVWDAAARALLSQPRGQLGPVPCVAFTPGGSRLATAAVDRKVCVWLLETGEEIPSLQPAETLGVSALSVTPDGKSILTGEMTGRVRLWESAAPRP